MKRNIYTLFPIVALFILTAISAGNTLPVSGPLDESEMAQRALDAPSMNSHPDLDGIVLFDGRYYKYTDGLLELRNQRMIRIFSEYALEILGDPRVSFDSSRQELIIYKARTYLPDGSFQDSPENAFNEVTPGGLALSVDHLNIRDMVVSHVGLELGVTILLDWTVRDLSPAEIPFNTIIFPQTSYPVLEMEILAEGGLMGESVNPSGTLFPIPDPLKEGGTLLWTVKNIPAEPGDSHYRLGDQLSWIVLSSKTSWESLTHSLHAGLETVLAGHSEVSSIMAQLEDEAPLVGDLETIEAWAGFGRDHTALVRNDILITTYNSRTLERVLQTSTATPLERCALFAAFCKEYDFDFQVLLPARWSTMSPTIPSLDPFYDPILHVTGKQGDLFRVNPTTGDVLPLRKPAAHFPQLVLYGSESTWINPFNSTNVVAIDIYWDLVEGTGKVGGLISRPGNLTMDYERPESLIQEWVESWTDSASAIDVRILESNLGRIRFHAQLNAPLDEEDERGRVRLTLPQPPISLEEFLPSGMNPQHSTCRARLFPENPVQINLNWTVKVPEEFQVLNPVEKETLSWFDASYSLIQSMNNGYLQIQYSLQWDDLVIEPGDYPAYRDFIIAALNWDKLTLHLGKSD